MKLATNYNKCGQFTKDYETGINYERLRAERLQRTQASMSKHGLCAIVAFTPDNYRYITGIKGELFTLGSFSRHTIVPVRGKPIHWEQGVDYHRVKEQTKDWDQEVRLAFPLTRSFHSASDKVRNEGLNGFIDNGCVFNGDGAVLATAQGGEGAVCEYP